jgi:leucyl aminopeptidase
MQSKQQLIGQVKNFGRCQCPEELRAPLDSLVADIANIGQREGGMLSAGLFLKEFVADGLPWAHLDIAGSGLQFPICTRLHP